MVDEDKGTERDVSGERKKNEKKSIDAALRPRSLDDIYGQDTLVENLRILVEAATVRGESLPHILFYGPPGLGKTSLSHVMAAEMGVNIRVTAGPAIVRAGELASILSNLRKGDILFIDEIHRLGRAVEEILYPAMEDFALDIVVGKGPTARNVRLKLPRFTVVGATTRLALLTSPLRARFGAVFRLDFYSEEALQHIIARAAQMLGSELTKDGEVEIARRSRGTPRVALRLLRRVRDYADVRADGIITAEVAHDALSLLGIDELGLDDGDRRYLNAIIEKFGGGPVGLDTIAASISEESDTIMDVYEPYLLQLGFIDRTPRGRVASTMAYEHLGFEDNRADQPRLF
jgi:Holliday junction DNA helicase RuvB